jgi:hypothetical protein
METRSPKAVAKVGTLHSSKPPGPSTSRFPLRARNAGREGRATLETESKGFLLKQVWAQSARDVVRANPLAVVGAALVLGLLVGRL